MVDFLRSDEIEASATDAVLDDRHKRYGRYIDQARISGHFRWLIRDQLEWRRKSLAADQEDALMMIVVKIARIINGDPDYADNWRDISGYATLVADRLDGKIR